MEDTTTTKIASAQAPQSPKILPKEANGVNAEHPMISPRKEMLAKTPDKKPVSTKSNRKAPSEFSALKEKCQKLLDNAKATLNTSYYVYIDDKRKQRAGIANFEEAYDELAEAYSSLYEDHMKQSSVLQELLPVVDKYRDAYGKLTEIVAILKDTETEVRRNLDDELERTTNGLANLDTHE